MSLFYTNFSLSLSVCVCVCAAKAYPTPLVTSAISYRQTRKRVKRERERKKEKNRNRNNKPIRGSPEHTYTKEQISIKKSSFGLQRHTHNTDREKIESKKVMMNGGEAYGAIETQYIRRHHRHELRDNQCTSALVKHIRAPVHLVSLSFGYLLPFFGSLSWFFWVSLVGWCDLFCGEKMIFFFFLLKIWVMWFLWGVLFWFPMPIYPSGYVSYGISFDGFHLVLHLSWWWILCSLNLVVWGCWKSWIVQLMRFKFLIGLWLWNRLWGRVVFIFVEGFHWNFGVTSNLSTSKTCSITGGFTLVMASTGFGFILLSSW